MFTPAAAAWAALGSAASMATTARDRRSNFMSGIPCGPGWGYRIHSAAAGTAFNPELSPFGPVTLRGAAVACGPDLVGQLLQRRALLDVAHRSQLERGRAHPR